MGAIPLSAGATPATAGSTASKRSTSVSSASVVCVPSYSESFGLVAVESLATEKDLALNVEVAPDLPIGRGDERRLAQVLLNLVGNAIKFTDRGSVSINTGGEKVYPEEVEAALKVADGTFTVAVRDTGPGISADHQVTIFEEFAQADTSSTRKQGGTGLGLSIAKRIIELHHGRIWVESVLGEGATFSFTVPVRVERQARQP